MTVTSIWPYFFCMSIFVGLAGFISSRVPSVARVFGVRDLPQTTSWSDPRFNAPLDALRGYLALSVLFHHAVITYFYFQKGVWEIPPSRFYELMGPVPVTLFFILSGYLFWSKALNDGGIRDFKTFWAARLRRILPAYYFLFFALIAYVAIRTDFTLREPLSAVAADVGTWFTVGVPFQFRSLNAFGPTALAYAGVTWTLRYELMFYMVMPLLALAATKRRMWFLLIAFAVANANLSAMASKFDSQVLRFFADFAHTFILGFGFGFIAAFVEQTLSPKARAVLRGRWPALGGLALVAIVYLAPIQSYSYLQSLPLMLFFCIVAARNDLNGLLRLKGSQLLGKISYAIYLFHGLVLHLMSLAVVRFYKDFAKLNAQEFWLYVAVCGALTVVLSTSIHRWIEMPFLKRRGIELVRSEDHRMIR